MGVDTGTTGEYLPEVLSSDSCGSESPENTAKHRLIRYKSYKQGTTRVEEICNELEMKERMYLPRRCHEELAETPKNVAHNQIKFCPRFLLLTPPSICFALFSGSPRRKMNSQRGGTHRQRRVDRISVVTFKI